MEQLSESQNIYLTYSCIPIIAVAFLLNHALVEGYTWTIPGAILGSIGALGYAAGIFDSDSDTWERLAIGSLLALLVWAVILLSLDSLGVGEPGPNIIAGLYLRELNSTFLDTILIVGIFSWLLYLGEMVLEDYGWGENPEAGKLGMEVDEHGIPLPEQSDEEGSE